LDEALKKGVPEIFKTDQGMKHSIDGRGRALDNVFCEHLWRSVKYEEVYQKDYKDILEARKALDDYFVYYNTQRPHAALGYRFPIEIHTAV
jgi:putative transposase